MTDRYLLSRRRALSLIGLAPTAILANPIAPPSTLRALFGDIGNFLNGAALHPIPKLSAAAGAAALARQVDRSGSETVPPTRAAIAHLLNVDEDEIAFVPSTGYAENMVAAAVGLGPKAGVVTDILHYESALAMYSERAKRGMPLTIVPAKDGRIRLDDIAAAMTPQTRLVAVAAISNYNGFRHDLSAVCDLAHSHGALVFADIIQAVGAVPFDAVSSGVDFCAASTYKWMMGDLGYGFLYASKRSQAQISRSMIGWAEISDHDVVGQTTVYDPQVIRNSWTYEKGARGLFEVNQPSKIASATVVASLSLIADIGLERIASHRDGLRLRAREGLKRMPGVIPLTPEEVSTTIESFAIPNAERRFTAPFAKAGIRVGLYPNRVRISPSIFNSPDDIDQLLTIISRH